MTIYLLRTEHLDRTVATLAQILNVITCQKASAKVLPAAWDNALQFGVNPDWATNYQDGKLRLAVGVNTTTYLPALFITPFGSIRLFPECAATDSNINLLTIRLAAKRTGFKTPVLVKDGISFSLFTLGKDAAGATLESTGLVRMFGNTGKDTDRAMSSGSYLLSLDAANRQIIGAIDPVILDFMHPHVNDAQHTNIRSYAATFANAALLSALERRGEYTCETVLGSKFEDYLPHRGASFLSRLIAGAAAPHPE